MNYSKSFGIFIGITLLVCQGCQQDKSSASKDNPQEVKAFRGDVPVTEQHKKQMAEAMEKQRQWGEKMKARGASGAGAPPPMR